ncbi:MAG: CHAT domain-containing protein [Sphingomonas bacterium]
MRFPSALLLLLAGLAASPAIAAPACPSGTTPAGYRQESYCTAQIALRSTISRSLGLLETRMAAGDGAFAAQLRTAQDLRDRRDKLATSERDALADNSPDGRVRYARFSAEAAQVASSLVAIEAAIRRDHPRWLDLARPTPLTEADTIRLLRPGEAMVFWYPTEEATFVWAINAKGSHWARIPIGATALAARVASFRAGLGVDGATRSARADRPSARPAFDRVDASALYTLLFPGAVDQVVRGARAVILVPSGSLTSLPFAALPMGTAATSPWLGLAKPLSLLPSPAGLRTLRGHPATASAAIAFAGFGAPALGAATEGQARGLDGVWRGGMVDGAALANLPSLPQAADELYDLARELGAPTKSVTVGANATESAVKRADLSHVRVLAFATHGLVAGDLSGLAEPALVFTPPAAPDDNDDGLLTASEAARLRLSADWVILSACSTATGNRVGAEALSGLASAFTYAGARALLVSQWQVGDDAARRLTTLAVRERTLGRAEALRRAMVAVANDPAHPEWADPSAWAVFELVGEGGR